uniref:Spectrin beta chain, brain 3 n=1 Tax=Anthurium amnicola TaxID=1678845 RepID=A0A1D1YD51_9ARAE
MLELKVTKKSDSSDFCLNLNKNISFRAQGSESKKSSRSDSVTGKSVGREVEECLAQGSSSPSIASLQLKLRLAWYQLVRVYPSLQNHRQWLLCRTPLLRQTRGTLNKHSKIRKQQNITREVKMRWPHLGNVVWHEREQENRGFSEYMFRQYAS